MPPPNPPAQPGVPIQVPTTCYISFSAEINPTTSEGLLRACCELSSKGVKTIYLLLSSPGGSVQSGIHVYNTLRAIPPKIITHNVASIDSIANTIFLAGDERYAVPEATFMFHGVGFNGQAGVRMEEKNLREQLDGITAQQKKIASIIERRATFTDQGEISDLFLQAATKDTEFAKDRGIIHDVREAKVPTGAPILQLVFNR